jgi:hypothetical protein
MSKHLDAADEVEAPRDAGSSARLARRTGRSPTELTRSWEVDGEREDS